MKYAGLLRIKALLDQYLAALADDGYDAIQQALAEFFGDHPEVRAIAWYQGAGLSYLAFELRHGARYLAAKERHGSDSASNRGHAQVNIQVRSIRECCVPASDGHI